MRSLQEIFDTAVSGVIAQGAPALNANGMCSYRTETGLKCGVGQLIPDELYRPEFENLLVGGFASDFNKELREAAGLPSEGLELELAKRIQHAHDNAANVPEDFLTRLIPGARSIANAYGLNTEVLDNGK